MLLFFGGKKWDMGQKVQIKKECPSKRGTVDTYEVHLVTAFLLTHTHTHTHHTQSQRKITQFLPTVPTPSQSKTIKSRRLRNVVARLTHNGNQVLTAACYVNDDVIM